MSAAHRFSADHLGIAGQDLWLKLECLQVTGSFKARGATNGCHLDGRCLPPRAGRGIGRQSWPGHRLCRAPGGVPAIIYLPSTAAPLKAEKLRRLGAEVRFEAGCWAQARRPFRATREAERIGAFYVHPFADEAVVSGQGTVTRELVEQVPDASAVHHRHRRRRSDRGHVAGIRRLRPDRGSSASNRSVPDASRLARRGHVVRLPEVTTKVATMACGRTDEGVDDLVRANVDEVVLIEDSDMQRAAELLWFDAASPPT